MAAMTKMQLFDRLHQVEKERDKFRDGLHKAVEAANEERDEWKERATEAAKKVGLLEGEIDRIRKSNATAQLRDQVAELERRCDWLLSKIMEMEG